MENYSKRFKTLASKSQDGLMILAAKELANLGYRTEFGKRARYIIATPENAPTLAIVAHLDTVRKSPPARRKIKTTHGIVRVKGGGILGADDRAGVMGVLEIARRAPLDSRPLILLTTDEEIGGVGAKELARDYTPPDSLRGLIELDRKGGNDYVTYSCDSPEANAYWEQFGFENATGSYTDICDLMPAWGIAGANLSIGYYGQHTSSEILILPQYAHTIQRALAMLLDPPAQRLEYVEEVRRYTWRDWKETPKPKVASWPDNPDPTPIHDPVEYRLLDDVTDRCDGCRDVYPEVELDWTAEGYLLCHDCRQEWRQTRDLYS